MTNIKSPYHYGGAIDKVTWGERVVQSWSCTAILDNSSLRFTADTVKTIKN